MIRHCFVSLCVVVLGADMASAYPVPAFDRELLLDGAETIAIVHALGNEEYGISAPSQEVATGTTEVAVREVLCGSSLPPVIRLLVEDPTRPFAVSDWTLVEDTPDGPVKSVSMGLVSGRTYLAFLIAEAGGAAWRVPSPYGLMRVTDGELGVSSDADCWGKVLSAVRSSIGDSEFEVKWNILNTLSVVEDDPEIIDEARTLSGSSNDLLAAKAMSYRVKMGDAIDLPRAVALIEDSGTLSVYDKTMLADQVISRNPGVPAVQLNDWLASSSSGIVTRASAQGLIERGDDSSIPVLLEALSHDETKVRANAHLALIRITGRQTSRYELFVDTFEDPKLNWLLWLRDFYDLDLTPTLEAP